MLAGRNKTIKPQDILLLMKLFSKEEEPWRIIDLASELNLSPSEVSIGLERLRMSGLIDSHKRKLLKSAVFEFLVHGLKYVFPAQFGTIQRGIPTAHSSDAFSNKIISDTKYVWPTEDGDTKGVVLFPIYETVPFAVKRDEKLYKMMAIIDSIRIGRVREQNLAKEILAKELSQ